MGVIRPTGLIYGVLLGCIGFFAGRQSRTIDRLFGQSQAVLADHHDQLTNAHADAFNGPQYSYAGDAASSTIGTSTLPSNPTAIRLHQRIEIGENSDLFNKRFRPLVETALRDKDGDGSMLQSCRESDTKPYLEILQSLHDDPLYYENDRRKKCPLLFLFYYEGGTQTLLDRWVQYHSNIQTKRCIKIIAPKRYRNTTDVHRLTDLGYELIGPSWPIKQDKVISINLDRLQKDTEHYSEPEETLISVNDLDHLLVWFDDGKPYQYSSYSDMVRLYVYELLSTSGCSNQMMAERYAVPCTCVLEDNQRYIDLGNGATIYSEYGKSNKFHPTSNFYLRNGKPPGTNLDDWQTGTVYANLRGYVQDSITHHKIGWKTKQRSEAAYAGVLHFRSDGYLTSTTKYMNFLLSNGWMSNNEATVEDVLFCASGKTSELIFDKKRCRGVKEIANIIAIVHQKRLCLAAGYSEEHCMNDLTCCVTEPGWPGGTGR